MVSLERDFKRQIELTKLEHQEEMFKLKQENFVLAAKVRGRNLAESPCS